MGWFWFLWVTDCIIAAVILYFFIIGLGDGSVDGRNINLWLGILLGLILILGGAWYLKTIDLLPWAKRILWILALPGLLYGLFLLIAIIARPRWN